MIRLISILLLLAGLAVAAYGGLRLSGQQLLTADVGEDAVPMSEIVFEEASAPEPMATESAPAPEAESDGVIGLVEGLEELSSGAGGPAAAQEPSFEVMGVPVPRALPTPPARTVEEVAESLREVPVAYETPDAVPLGKTFDVTFAIDATGDETATDGLPGGSDARVVEGTARVSDRVKAQLTGSAFDIVLSSPDVQRLSLDTENVWRWRVRALEAGDHPLIMELFVLEGPEPRPVRTFNDRVIVSVSPLQRAIGAANTANPIVMVLGGIGSALGGLFGVFRFFRPGR